MTISARPFSFLLASNMSEVLSIFFATLMGFTILKPVHLLWINLITDCFPALALGMEPGEADIMKRKPRNAKDGIFAGGMGLDVALQGVIITGLTMSVLLCGAPHRGGGMGDCRQPGWHDHGVFDPVHGGDFPLL